MKHYLLPLTLLVFMSFSGFGQVRFKSKMLKSTQPASTFSPSKIQVKYGPLLITEEAPEPSTEMEEEELHELKEHLKPIENKSYKRTLAIPAAPPQILDTLGGNSYAFSAPNDNSFAIGQNGQLLSLINTNIFAYDTKADTLLYQVSLSQFSKTLSEAVGGKYDPRVLYDPTDDRFIIVFLNGTIYQTSKVVVAFSKSNNVMDGFNLYALEGNPLNDSTWSDYPHITISDDDLFITVNTFHNGSTNNNGYVQSTIRQIRKSEGYSGASLIQKYYYNLSVNAKNLFNFTGIKGGKGTYPPPTYFMSDRNLDLKNDSLFLVSISDHLTPNNDPQIAIKTIYSETPYGLPPDARQKDGNRFDCDDCRIQDGIFVNNKIQFVGNTINSYGHSSFFHGIYNLREGGDTASFDVIENDTVDYGYPNINYTGKSVFEDEAIITFDHSGPNTNSGFSAVFYANDHTYSEPIILQKGQGYVDVLGQIGAEKKDERWGDYTGGQPAYGETGVVWASGYNSFANKRPGTWLAKLRSPTYKDEPVKANSDIAVSPNPATDYFQVEFQLDQPAELSFTLVAMNGKITRRETLLTEDAEEGNNTFVFDTSSLSSGLYYLLITDAGGNVLKEQKIIRD